MASQKPLVGMDRAGLKELKEHYGFSYKRIASEARVAYDKLRAAAAGKPVDAGTKRKIRIYLDDVFAVAHANPKKAKKAKKKALPRMDLAGLKRLKTHYGLTNVQIARESRVPRTDLTAALKGSAVSASTARKLSTYLDAVNATAAMNPQARKNFLFGKKKTKVKASTAPKLGYKEGIAIAREMQATAEAQLGRHAKRFFLVKAPAIARSGKPIWYFLKDITQRHFDSVSSYSTPQGKITSANPWPTVRSNLAAHRSPQQYHVVVLNTYTGQMQGPLSYTAVAGKAGASNPGRGRSRR